MSECSNCAPSRPLLLIYLFPPTNQLSILLFDQLDFVMENGRWYLAVVAHIIFIAVCSFNTADDLNPDIKLRHVMFALYSIGFLSEEFFYAVS